MDKTSQTKELIFFPYYINQARLIDLSVILNDGYSEYEEIKSLESEEKKKGGSANADANAGFRLFNLGTTFSGEIAKGHSSAKSALVHKVHTPTSMLSLVIQELQIRGYVRNILDSQEGSFVLVPVKLKINSIKALIREAKVLIELSEKMTSINKPQNKGAKAKSPLLQQIQQIENITKELFDIEEIVHDAGNYAIVGTISDNHLYQAVRDDIIDVKLTCLAQVKRIFPEGTSLMKNTVFTKLTDNMSKQALIDSLKQITEKGSFEYSSEAITEISNKPVYQLEIVALFRGAEPIS